MSNKQRVAPDSTAVRTALWRALHVEADAPPHVFEDTLGLKLAAPDDGWRHRPDMSAFTRPFRASIIARATDAAGAMPAHWIAPPVLNPYTRIAVEINAARGLIRAVGYERLPQDELASPATSVREFVAASA